MAERSLRLTHCFAGCILFFFSQGCSKVYAVKAAGLAIGIGSSCIVLVSFCWGIFVFHEHVHSIGGACWAILALMVGIVGMSYYSSPMKKGQEEVYENLALAESAEDGHPHLPETTRSEKTSDPEDDNRLQSDSAFFIDVVRWSLVPRRIILFDRLATTTPKRIHDSTIPDVLAS